MKKIRAIADRRGRPTNLEMFEHKRFEELAKKIYGSKKRVGFGR